MENEYTPSHLRETRSFSKNPFDRIPNEILIHLMTYFKSRELLIIKNVCRLWYDLIHKVIGFNINMGSSSLYPPSMKESINMNLVVNIGIRSVEIGLCELPFPEILQQFKYPQTLKHLHLAGFIDESDYFSIPKSFTALQELQLSYSAISRCEITKSHFENFKLLKIFCVCNKDPNLMHISTEKGVFILNNMIRAIQFLNSKQLTKLLLEIPFESSMDKDVYQAVIHCINKHYSTLECLQIYHGIDITGKESKEDDEFLSSPIKDPEDKELNSIVTTGLTLTESTEHGRRARLKRISISMPHEPILTAYWESLVKQQNYLEEFFYLNWNSYGAAEGIKCIQANEDSLKKILIHVGNTHPSHLVVLDGNIFKRCSQLSHLLIRGRKLQWRVRENNLNMDLISSPQLKNASDISQSVQLLSFRGVDVTSVDIHIILESFHNLMKLRLMDIGVDMGRGIRVQDFLNILQEKKLNEIEILRSFNAESINDSLEEPELDHLQHFFLKHVRKLKNAST